MPASGQPYPGESAASLYSLSIPSDLLPPMSVMGGQPCLLTYLSIRPPTSFCLSYSSSSFLSGKRHPLFSRRRPPHLSFSIPSDFAILSGLPLLRHGIPSLLPIRIRSALPRVSALPPLFPFDAAAPIPARRQYAHSRCTEIFYHRPAVPGEYRLKPYEPRKIPLNGGFPVVFSVSVQSSASPRYTRSQPARGPAYHLLSYGEKGWDKNPSCPFYGFMV